MKRTPGSTSAERENYWTELITRAREHHLSVQEFCEQEGISSNNYYSWFKKLRPEHPEWKKDLPPHGAKKKSRKRKAKIKRLVPVEIKVQKVKRVETDSEPLELRLRSGHCVILPATFSAEQLALLLKNLES
ncbi:MAG TPA: hypothetical protein EYN91_15960 [Candidatus Melainabacteria bacterium]|nr:hypothetical protein [Candidatus Melainabacteria bacterium]HIN63746.1 hypothetical protein [Candidatus Obscuribacterales bacterium]